MGKILGVMFSPGVLVTETVREDRVVRLLHPEAKKLTGWAFRNFGAHRVALVDSITPQDDLSRLVINNGMGRFIGHIFGREAITGAKTPHQAALETIKCEQEGDVAAIESDIAGLKQAKTAGCLTVAVFNRSIEERPDLANSKWWDLPALRTDIPKLLTPPDMAPDLLSRGTLDPHH